jgi:hypothetical protein
VDLEEVTARRPSAASLTDRYRVLPVPADERLSWQTGEAFLYVCAPLAALRSFVRSLGLASMIYIIAIVVPPLALLLNGQLFAAIFNFMLIVPCVVVGLIFHVLLLVPSAHAIIAIYHNRENRKHREIVEAIREHGPPPGWRG